MSQRKHADLWKKLVDEAGEDEIDRAANVSVEQAEAQLRAAGFDVAAERAKANAFLDALEGEPRRAEPEPRRQPRPQSQPQPPRIQPRAMRRPALVWLAVAASMGAAAGGSVVATLQRLPSPGVGAPATGSAAATELRRQATAACDAKQWSVCLAELDKARAFDPGGDSAAAVKSLRDKAIAEILK
jgi:hypothetical protein